MPYRVGAKGSYGCNGYPVVKDDGEVMGCHTTEEAAKKQITAINISESQNKVTKAAENLYAELTPEEKAFHDALVNIANEYGPFDKGASSIWVGYESPQQNEDAEIGVKCGNCSLHVELDNGSLGCKILSYAVEENAKCRLAAIPDGYVQVANDDIDDQMEMMKNIWEGRLQPIKKAKDKPNYSDIIKPRKGEPADKELYNRIKAEAKKKFNVYPSAVANAWVVAEYKRRGGRYKNT
jgi:hypothetical protein